MKIRFYNRDGTWYADLPEYLQAGGTEEECMMVDGADTWLDYISGHGDNVVVELCDEDTSLQEKLHRMHQDEFGATYIAGEYKGDIIQHQLWLCPVTLFVFGGYPSVINYRVL